MVILLILALAVAIVAVIFALQNIDMVTVTFFTLSFDGSLALVILLSVALGILIGVLVMAPGNIKNKLASTRSRKKISALEASLNDHKSKLASLEEPSAPASTQKMEESKNSEIE